MRYHQAAVPDIIQSTIFNPARHTSGSDTLAELYISHAKSMCAAKGILVSPRAILSWPFQFQGFLRVPTL